MKESLSAGEWEALLVQGREVLRSEAATLTTLAERLGDSFPAAVALLLTCRGRVIVTGVGKSGHIGRKIAATLACTGTPAFFVHAGEGLHGDLGMVGPEDIVLAISHSGETAEILGLLPYLQANNVPLLALTGGAGSTLGRRSRVNIVTYAKDEADHLGLAPVNSTTAALAVGDALALTLAKVKRFTPAQFAARHPGGSLGRMLKD